MWPSPVRNIAKLGRKLYKLKAKLHLRPSVNHGFHCDDFHENRHYSIIICGHLVYRILPKSEENYKLTAQLHIPPSVNHGLHWDDFYENRHHSIICDHLLYRILPNSEENYKLMAQLHIRPSVNHDFHYSDFHVTQASSTALCEYILYSVSFKSVGSTGRNLFTLSRKHKLSPNRLFAQTRRYHVTDTKEDGRMDVGSTYGVPFYL